MNRKKGSLSLYHDEHNHLIPTVLMADSPQKEDVRTNLLPKVQPKSVYILITCTI